MDHCFAKGFQAALLAWALNPLLTLHSAYFPLLLEYQCSLANSYRKHELHNYGNDNDEKFFCPWWLDVNRLVDEDDDDRWQMRIGLIKLRCCSGFITGHLQTLSPVQSNKGSDRTLLVIRPKMPKMTLFKRVPFDIHYRWSRICNLKRTSQE